MKLPGPRSRELAARLARHESRNVTFIADDAPIFWESASGATVLDADGNAYIDCTAAFGVANAGHANPHVASAVAAQARRLAHGLGDVHPSEIRVRLLERLAAWLPAPLDRFFLASTGSEAVEAALKTAMLATGKAGFAAYRGGYHGLSLGALAVGGIERFRSPFAAALGVPPLLLPFPADGEADAAQAAREAGALLDRRDDFAALLVEPVQGRGGIVVPPPGYLQAIRRICEQRRILLIADEIYTGFGRTGSRFAIEHEAIVPDVLCLGKALGNGVPISAIAARREVMDAWPPSTGEALHTSTFLGNPLGCAAALATLDEMDRLQLPERARRLGERLQPRLKNLAARPGVEGVRGRGLLYGVALGNGARAAAVVRRALAGGAIFLQSGVRGEVLTIAPPLTVEWEQLARALDILEVALDGAA